MSPYAALYDLTNEALLEETGRLASRERRSTAQLIAAIAEIDARRLYLAEGCSSMWAYCTQVLMLSEHATYHRITAARLSRRFPIILERLADGSLTLSNLKQIGPYITADSCEALLDAVAFKSKREVEAVVSALRPQLATGNVYRLQLAISRQAWEQLRRVQDLLQHSIHDGDPSRIFERAIAVLLTEVEKQKLGKTDRPRPQKDTPPLGRKVSAAVRREVNERDGGRCAFVGRSGRCTARGTEYHHLVPFAVGGPATVENIELRCRPHNQYESEVFYGPRAWDWRRERERRTRPGASGTASDAAPGANVEREAAAPAASSAGPDAGDAEADVPGVEGALGGVNQDAHAPSDSDVPVYPAEVSADPPTEYPSG